MINVTSLSYGGSKEVYIMPYKTQDFTTSTVGINTTNRSVKITTIMISRLILNTAMLLCVAVSVVSADDSDTNTTVTDTTGTEMNTTHGTDEMLRNNFGTMSRFSQSLLCFLSCHGSPFLNPTDCMCKNKPMNCQSKQCGDKEKCQMRRGRFPLCIKDKSVCALSKSAMACDSSSVSYYYNKDTMRCEMYASGECSGNDNVFKTWIECTVSCRSKPKPKPRKGIFKRIKGKMMRRFRGRGSRRGPRF